MARPGSLVLTCCWSACSHSVQHTPASQQVMYDNYRQQQALSPAVGGRGSLGQGINMPPPYRAPPPQALIHGQHPPPPPKGSNLPYSRFNVSDPNIGGYKSSPVPGYRHTINTENSSQVQTNLKQMLAMPKHNTLDINGQNVALHHLRMQVKIGTGIIGRDLSLY